eukprot:TRINITY_DN18598_c0_g1_i1.p1 TRINITY_DN18598_c0_g1~~TRINITY_DN18598_c0_g1_i1.p1  ORF type:complete len:354 (+),score=97.13 TRINITY_DN18598_c0_g1_i1:94-1062(+)
MEAPPFKLGQSRYDQKTFRGRLQQISAQLDPCKLLVSPARLDKAMAQLQYYRLHRKNPEGVSDADMWAAQELCAARVHPDTNQKIFTPLCFAAYAPMQPPIILGMIWPGAGALNQAFWQWYNASYNAAVFYANRNASSEISNSQLGLAYGCAVAGSIGVGAGMIRFADRLKARGGRFGGPVRAFAPYAGTVCGGVTTLLCMRWQELSTGVTLRDPATGQEHGRSKVAAREGLGMCSAARFIWNIPVFAFTPMLHAAYHRSRMAAAFPALKIPMEVLLASMCIVLGIYPAQAMFTQQALIPASRLEPEFQGKGIECYVYNKGL